MSKPEDTHVQLAKSFYKNNLDAALALYTDDAVFVAADGTPVSGAQWIKAELETFAAFAASMKT